MKVVKHKGLLGLVKKIVDVPLGYSKEDLIALRNIATTQYPALVDIIDQYIHLTDASDTWFAASRSTNASRRAKSSSSQNMHLFDMLRNEKLFPTNLELADFASRIMPSIPKRRFAKISRPEIAARILDHLEKLPVGTRRKLEASMREAMAENIPPETGRQSFLSKWERIIKSA